MDRLTDLRTDMYENITFSETTLAGGNKAILEPMRGVGEGRCKELEILRYVLTLKVKTMFIF